MNIGENINNARKAAGISQKELAEQTGVYQKDISRWENGERTPTVAALAQICKVLQVSADDVLELNGKEKRTTD